MVFNVVVVDDDVVVTFVGVVVVVDVLRSAAILGFSSKEIWG